MLILVYDLREDTEHVRQMQEASLDTDSPHGLAPDPLVGSEEWWAEVDSGARSTTRIDGVIEHAFWAGMGDWPEFTVRGADGRVKGFARDGDGRRLVEGLEVRVDLVRHSWKQRDHGDTDVVLAIWVEDSPRRISNVAPGPGGAGHRSALALGEAVHYLVLPDEAAATRCAAEVKRKARVYRVAAPSCWYVECWTGKGADIDEFSRIASDHGGRYDGGEHVGGEVWGPAG